jgi:hypothetical protein
MQTHFTLIAIAQQATIRMLYIHNDLQFSGLRERAVLSVGEGKMLVAAEKYILLQVSKILSWIIRF